MEKSATVSYYLKKNSLPKGFNRLFSCEIDDFKCYYSSRISMMVTAALATEVPGPKMPKTPALYRKS